MTDALARPAPAHRSHGWGWLLAYGIMAAILSAMAFIWPFSATFAATIVVAAFLIANGIGALVAAFRHRGERRVYDIIVGLLSLVVGTFVALAPAAGAISITMTLAIWLGARGAMEVYWGIKYRRRRAPMIAMGALHLLLMLVVVLSLPLSALVVPGTLLGFSFLVTAITAIMAALDMRRDGDAARA